MLETQTLFPEPKTHNGGTAMIHSEQHDDHCYMVFHGHLCWIIAARPGALLVTNELGKFVIDMSCFDYQSYVAKAEKMTKGAWAA
jgi:hypothetical protein